MFVDFLTVMEFSCLALLGHVSFDVDLLFHSSSYKDLPSILMVINLLILLADRDLSVDQFNNTVVQFQCHFFGLIEVIGHLLFQ